MRVRRLAAAGTAALLLPFAACSDGDSNAKPSEPTTSSAAPSPSETRPAGPTLPPEARGDGEAAAKAFVKFYFELISEAMVTGDTDPLRGLSNPKCKSCLALARNIEKVYDKGGRFETAGWSVTKLAVDPVPDEDQIAFLARVAIKGRILYDESGQVVTRSPEKTQAMHLLLTYRTGDWQMRRMGLL